MPPAVLPFPQIDPFMFRIGNTGLSWYAFSYLFSIIVGYFVLRYFYRKGRLQFQKPEDVGLLATYFFYGLILGARLFYVIFYNPKFYLEHPLEIPAIWHGGMSFHGGLFGAALAIWIFCRRHQAIFFQVTDAIFFAMPLGLGLGRLTNFINGELWGRPSDVPWAMVFPRAGPEPRHPSQLYEAILEGPILFLIIWLTFRMKPKDGVTSAVGILGYGVLRFVVEFFREPDEQLGTLLGPLSMGQLLCIAMVLFGLSLLIYRRNQPE